ncbi:MAG TPA: hypothetical protein VNE67_17860, partial [Acetobacteraceae bacterium]|nr:hypothetical protein [Acetobacteraceae bacterium]
MSSERAQPRRAARRLGAASLLVVLAGCATYRPLPLPAAPGLADSLATLRHAGVASETPLTVQDVAYLAVENDPTLRAARAR